MLIIAIQRLPRNDSRMLATGEFSISFVRSRAV
jgi:hypothetical protein